MFAQDLIPVNGKVVSKDNIPLSGVSVNVKNTKTGTTTDADGAFKLMVKKGQTIVVSYVGYESREYLVDGNTADLGIQLSPRTGTMSDVVVVGYGTQSRKSLSGSVAKVEAGEFKNTIVNTVDQALQGRAAGVQSIESSGEPGADAVIRIRGNNSLNGNNEPLYVIDGFIIPPYTEASSGGRNGAFRQNPLMTINPNDIASIEVLKDASATAIYGSRGANGVVLITTKSGRRGDARIEFVNKTSFGSLASPPTMMNARQYATVRNEYAAITGNLPAYDLDTLNTSTNWFDEITRNSFREEVALNVSGGTNKSAYYVSGSYLQDDGVLIASGFKRGNVRVNLNSEVNKWYTLRLQAGVTRMVNDRAMTTTLGFPQVAGPVLDALRALPTLPKSQSGTYNGSGGFPGGAFLNPYIDLTEKVDKTRTDNILFNLENIFTITNGLRLTIAGGSSFDNSKRDIFFNSRTNNGIFSNGEGSVNTASTTGYNLTGYFTYDNLFSGKHRFNAVLGGEYTGTVLELVTTRASDFGIQTLENYNLGIGRSQGVGTYREDRTIMSGFTRINYGFDDRYNLNVSLRADGASPFAANKKWGFFPAVGASWNVSNESFMQGVNFVDNLKLRASYGITGSQAISPYQSLSRYNTAFFQYGSGNGYSTILRPTSLGNADLTWEETKQFNIGVDFSVVKNRISASFDYYQKLTNGLLQSRSIPSQSGFRSVLGNDGEMLNKGIELSLKGVIIEKKDMYLGTTFILSRNYNEIKSFGLNNADRFFTLGGNGLAGVSHILRPGERVGNFYGYMVERLVQPSDFNIGVPNYPFPGGAASQVPGSWKYVDLNKDGIINSADRTVLGNGVPDFTFGWTTDFTYKRWGINMFFNGAVGYDILNVTGFYLNSGFINYQGIYFNQTEEWYNKRWTTNNQHNDVRYPSLHTATNGLPVGDVTSALVEKGDFIRLKSLTINYTFPSVKGFKDLRLFATGTNLLTITKYSGFDPEVSSYGQSLAQPGIDFGAYPRNISVTFGVSCAF
ncbi:TonB-dependent receptor [Flavihumibacter rivuli]|uniref:SusC/RagA family TonB-linked outer membrane protein n=1 Tax=Flavihumibacter rivuli TaxID=2838156 RepID=UPI001BDF454B|nr:TonB-dependent receptor [Flavihumibacter rivuli]ULQ55342.1 TonB-dependent receptor [Flavihumibacter rivuli]